MESRKGESRPSAQALREAVSVLSQKRIYFGHQSVGYNIVSGIESVMRETGTPSFRLAETREPSDFDAPIFAHSKNGENRKPSLKIRTFSELVDGRLAGKLDLAFFKFCYIDIVPDTDVVALFHEYREAMARLKASHPRTTFVHLTAPLTVIQSGPKAWVKRLIGRPLEGVAHNLKLNEYNNLLLGEYSGKEPVFDLAAVESTHPGGRRETFAAGGRDYLSLVPAYGSDGRHLNDLGSRRVAEELLVFLAGLSR